ncbi:MAG: hypothetical protein GY906_23660 [bacterium]|nr:hypothetical protein [bacterium]
MNEQRAILLTEFFTDKVEEMQFKLSLKTSTITTAAITVLANLLAHAVAEKSLSDPRYGLFCLDLLEKFKRDYKIIMHHKDAASYTLQTIGAVIEQAQLACKHVLDKEGK